MSFDWLHTFKFNVRMLRYTALWPENGRYVLNFYSFYAVIVIVFMMHLYNFCIFMGIVLSSENLIALTLRICMAASQILMSAKAHFMTRNIKKLNELSRDLENVLPPPKNKQQIELVKPDIATWKFAYFMFCSACWLTSAFISIAPLLNGTTKNFELPTRAWFPYNVEISPNYEITYIYETLALACICAAVVNVDLFVMNWMMTSGLQCEILCDNLRNLSNEYGRFGENLIGCIKHHQAVLSVTSDCNNCYNLHFLWQMSNSCITLALMLFQLTVVDPSSSDIYTIFTYASAAATQIFMYCWFGNHLEFKSSQIPYSAFESDWTGAPIEAKKNLLIFIMRSQKPIKMSAINLFSLSLATFTTILRTSWSYFAVLRQVNAQD